MLFALLLCEVVARILLPPQQTVEVADTRPPDSQSSGGADTPREFLDTSAETSIDSAVIFGGTRGARLRPNTRAQIRRHRFSGRNVVLEVNSVGLRYAELGPKTKDEFRVFVLGDSITLGDFLPEDETFTRAMEKQTTGRSRTIRFINGGIPGAGSMEELYLYEETQDRVQPDLVLLAMYLNDAQTAGEFYVRSIPLPFSSSRFLTWAANRVQLVGKTLFRGGGGKIDPIWRERFRAGRDLRSGAMFDSKDGFDFEIYHAYKDFGLAWNPRSWEILDGIMASLEKETRESGIRLAILLFPVHIQVLGTYEDHWPQDRCRALCVRRGIPYLDLLPGLRSEWQAKGERLFYDHCHYTPYGYSVVARETVRGLTENRLIPN